jgi:hypothetical protein
MKGYDTYKPPKLKDCISKIIITKDTQSWMIKKLITNDIQPESFKISDRWQVNTRRK